MALDRRSALTLGAGALAVAPHAARACTIAVPLPDEGAHQLATIFEMFRLWWAREEREFFRLFDGPRLSTPEGDAGLDAWLAGEGRAVADLYRATFTQQGSPRDMETVTIIDGRAFVSVREYIEGELTSSCSGGPESRQFLIDFRDATPVSMIALPAGKHFPAGQVTHWTSGR